MKPEGENDMIQFQSWLDQSIRRGWILSFAVAVPGAFLLTLWFPHSPQALVGTAILGVAIGIISDAVEHARRRRLEEIHQITLAVLHAITDSIASLEERVIERGESALGRVKSTTELVEKQTALTVSWSSLDKRKAEYDTLVHKKIPENLREIGVARSYGDLRENFEYKAAKEMQRVLMRRKSELEAAFQRARGTSFESPDTTQVSIGTIVTLREFHTGRDSVLTILGAWDDDPKRGIISYLTAIGQALLGHKVGQDVTLTDDTKKGQFEIISIEAAPVDMTPPDPSLSGVPAEAVAAPYWYWRT